MARAARHQRLDADPRGGGVALQPFAWLLLLFGLTGAAAFALIKGSALDASPSARAIFEPDEFKIETVTPDGAESSRKMSPEDAFLGIDRSTIPKTEMPVFPEAEPDSADPDAAGEAPDIHSEIPAAPAIAAGPDALAPVPDPALVFYGRHGPLPVIAPDGRMARKVYARPFELSDPRPRIALIVGGLGLSRSMTEMAIKALPGAVTLSFTPYAKDLQLLINEARAAGHEVMLELPMEPFDYPHNDPGPYTLLTQADVDENLDKLDWIMSRFTGYAGVVSDQGDKMLGSMEDLRPILAKLNERGLYFVDPAQAKRSMAGRLAHELGLAWTLSTGPVDQPASRNGIELRLLQIEEDARGKGTALATGFAYPTTIDQIKEWSKSLDAKGLVLAPVSAVVTTPQREPSG